MGDGGGHLFGGRVRRSGAAGLASVGAGSIHAAAATAHADHAPALALFALLAVCQVGWGLLALGSIGRPLIVLGALGNAAAVGGWLLAKTVGIDFVRGLEHAEPAQLADCLAALLAAGAVACAVAALAGARRGAGHAALGPALTAGLAVVVVGAAAAGVTATPGHAHGGAEHGSSAHHDAAPRIASAQHEAAGPRDRASRAARRRNRRAIGLGGVEGVTPAQQARAERLVTATRRRLPAFADVSAAQAAGYRSIGDEVTGHEHYVKWSSINDDHILDPRHAESLVYRVDGDDRTLVAAMYMLREGATLDTVPDVGGRLTQWHVHDDLCLTDDAAAPVVAAITTPGGSCPPRLVKRARIPMLHVWIVRHECGPFAALEGIGGGQVKGGEQPRCHRTHGAH